LIIVTGSSRGIGEAIATEFGQHFKNDAHILLMARDITKLNQVKKKILSSLPNSNNKVSVLNMDFSADYKVNDYFKLIKEILDDDYLANFDELYVIYNHGTLEFGSVSLVAQSNMLQEKFEVNLFSIWNLLAAVNLLIPTTVISKQFHVNISSGYSNEPTANWSAHCSG
jgi:short-subunit dehydrogenase